MDKVQPQPNGENSKVKVKLRINVHGIFSVSSASMVEKVQEVDARKEEPMDTENDASVSTKEEDKSPDKAATSPKKKDADKEQTTTNDEVGWAAEKKVRPDVFFGSGNVTFVTFWCEKSC